MGLPTHREVLGLFHHDRQMHQPQPILPRYSLYQRSHRLGAAHTARFHFEQVTAPPPTEGWCGVVAHDWLVVS